MTAKSSRRVVIINNIKSDKIEQAIFILRGTTAQRPDRTVIKEAQSIIDDYIRRVGGRAEAETVPAFASGGARKRRIGAGLLTVMVSAVLLGLVFVLRYFAG